MISETLKKARDYETKYMKFADQERPSFHITGGIGWINDPNGFSVYKGEYHLFFQYHPYSTEWGPMHWGHVKTKDFVKWERLPIAIAPDTEADQNGCFSGSAIEMPDGRQLLMYTGVKREEAEDGSILEYQHQCIAVGDGVDYEKCELNPVINADMLPDGVNIYDFRDPKIWEEDGIYYVAVGNRPADGSGAVLLYESKDTKNWKYCGVIDACYNEYGKMWECPDFFPLCGQQVLLVSPQEMTPIGLEFHAGYGTVCLIGDYDKEKKSFIRNSVQAIDYGIDFYAPQTLLTPDGRRVMIAWMQNWTTSNCKSKKARLMGSMTFPRELSIKNGRLIQNPVKELENYWGRKVSYENVLVNKEIGLSGVKGRVLDMTVTVKPASDNGYKWFKINLAKDGEHWTTIRFKPDTNTVRIDRTRCGGRFDIVHVRDFMVNSQNGEIKLRILLDKNSVELFVNDGEQAATFLLYCPLSAQAISFESEGTVSMSVEKYDLPELEALWEVK